MIAGVRAQESDVATNEGEVYFKLIGDFDPDVVTKEIGIEPSRTKRKGHPRPKYDSWQYSHGKVVADFINVYEMSAKLITVLQPKEPLIESLVSRVADPKAAKRGRGRRS